ncbi:uncharacterized protein PV09_04929 [Verruconis gallopava]|uniref:VOC domain-containing protein n=1 Tax=Verruconis gallopava TaxID=253628 RepID=A0A0D2AY91_9PEZI|nr:uncharacterized protein PV09_04929 [Verruconis gallopava]KIW04119.1 hypothetical protein PV09_04929 [Verruconis gallopava]
MLDHASISVPKDQFEDVIAWYIKALEPLGYKKIHEYAGLAVGLGDPKPDFWIGARDEGRSVQHIAFGAKDRDTVRKFYEAAIAAGGKDNGGPGVRSSYHEHYYGAFVFDPVGNNVEAVCHSPE